MVEMKRLREAPISSGKPKFFKRAELGQSVDALLGRLAEADAGVEHDLLAAQCRRGRRWRASARKSVRCRP